jgi:aromatic ring-opening dioxygenase catalytic subunit (LigB family)
MPALFLKHVNPMNALLENPILRSAAIGTTLPKPEEIVSVPSHRYIGSAAVTVRTTPSA